MINLYCGFDPREEVGFHTFCASVLHNSSEPVAITPLHLPALRRVYKGGAKDGTNAFIYSRFLIPYLNNYRGFAIFADGCDMLLRDDLAGLWDLRDVFYAVQVVKHDYKTKHVRKYVGTEMEADNEDYPCKNWSSLMILNCAHYAWRKITPETVEEYPGSVLHRFSWMAERYVGELPIEWNWLADEYGPNPQAKLLHWTAGIPAWEHYKDAPHADEWHAASDLLTG